MRAGILLLVTCATVARGIRTVNVEVRRSLGVAPAVASAAWLDYTWSCGGGLRGLLLREPSDAAVPRERLILPVGLRERLEDGAGPTRRYRVVGGGLVRDLVADSHRGSVSFEATDGGCEMVWTADYEVTARQKFWQAATEFLVGAAGDNLVKFVAEPSRPRWFDPLAEFDFGSSAGGDDRPLLFVLPGLDGSAVTAWTQYPELGAQYELKALAVPANARVDFDELVAIVVAEAERHAGRQVFILGESIGAGVALAVGRASKDVDGLVLVSPATGWAETPLGGAREWLLTVPDVVLMAVVTLSTYQLVDAEQVATTVERIRTGERSPLLRGADREAYAWAVVKELPKRLALDAGGLRWRLATWIEPAYAAASADALAGVACPVLCVAGTADLRVPAEAEATRISRAVPRGTVHVVRGAGHAGARTTASTSARSWRPGADPSSSIA